MPSPKTNYPHDIGGKPYTQPTPAGRPNPMPAMPQPMPMPSAPVPAPSTGPIAPFTPYSPGSRPAILPSTPPLVGPPGVDITPK